MEQFTTSSKTKNSLTTDSSNKSNILAQLRRLRIQESLLLQNLNKYPLHFLHHEKDWNKYCAEFKTLITHIKNEFTDIKNLFEDVKMVTKSKELKTDDIEEVKRDVLHLETKIKQFKNFLQSEQVSLEYDEKLLNAMLLDKNGISNSKLKVKKKEASKTYSGIVPSPVKSLISSPLKYQEVQELQDFLSSTNKLGGWNEYNHLIFEKVWLKFVKNGHDAADLCENNKFITEVFGMVSGLLMDDVISHVKWYSRYVYLKQRQQKALDNWKAKNKSLKAPNHCQADQKFNYSNGYSHKRKSSAKYSNSSIAVKNATKTNLEQTEIIESNSEIYSLSKNDKQESTSNSAVDFLFPKRNTLHRYTKPTEQWRNKCTSPNDILTEYNNIDNVKRLAIPSWRVGLHGK
ncbi:hypothetical protein ACJJTC_003183 [Scirpophaga incertulas]